MSTTIRRVEVTSLDVPMLQPFGIAGGAQEVAELAVVCVELASGLCGYGEAAPFPAFNGETRDAVLEALEAARPELLGEDVRAYRRLAARIAAPTRHSGAARCALETAVLDAVTRSFGIPLWSWFGGVAKALVTDVTLPFGSEERAERDAAARAAEGFTCLKVKVGAPRSSEDLARLVAIARAAPHCDLVLDANGGLSVAAALDLLADLRHRGITPRLFEQPVAAGDLAGLAEVRRRGGVPIAADESVCSAAEVLALHRAGAADVVNIKLMKSGVMEALAIATTARACGLSLMIGGMVEARLAMGMSACLAAGFGGFSFVDLDTPLFLAEDPYTGGYVQRGPALDLSPITAGHGATPAMPCDRARFSRPDDGGDFPPSTRAK